MGSIEYKLNISKCSINCVSVWSRVTQGAELYQPAENVDFL